MLRYAYKLDPETGNSRVIAKTCSPNRACTFAELMAFIVKDDDEKARARTGLAGVEGDRISADEGAQVLSQLNLCGEYRISLQGLTRDCAVKNRVAKHNILTEVIEQRILNTLLFF